jgi:multidrug efflux pump
LATGAGAESRQQIGWVIVGGMSLGTLLTIFVVPTMYMLLSRSRHVSRVLPEDAPLSVAGDALVAK